MVMQPRLILCRKFKIPFHRNISEQYILDTMRGWRLMRPEMEDILDLNPSNIGYFTYLFSQKLSGLQDEDIDCSNPSAYFETVQTAFLVLETGIECYITRSGGGFSSGLPSAIRLKFSWSELKPLLKKP
jgi:hypothetical protein